MKLLDCWANDFIGFFSFVELGIEPRASGSLASAVLWSFVPQPLEVFKEVWFWKLVTGLWVLKISLKSSGLDAGTLTL